MIERLPIYDIEAEIVASLGTARRLIVQAPTGSGKSTQVPQILLKHGFLGAGQAVILQPRRLAARLLASRVAQELGVRLGSEVGYQVRFENVTSAATHIKFETEGILLRQMIQNPGLDGIQALIFDEFHERHLYGDITLARALDIQESRRPDLLILVMSATLDAGALEKYLRPCTVLKSEGRTFPVDVEFLSRRSGKESPAVWDLAADAFSKHARGADGDVLVFMPGGYEINRTIDAIRHKSESKGYLLLPLHGELAPRDQDAAVARYDQRKVVVATNVAETSITIDGVRLVIDSGLARIPRFDPHRGINTLLVEKISQASAEQRSGRSGRTAPGKSVRLWSQAEHGERPVQELPEVKRLDLSEVVLTLKAAGVLDLRAFRWLEHPNETALQHAEELLVDLGALIPNSPPESGGAAKPEGRAGVVPQGQLTFRDGTTPTARAETPSQSAPPNLGGEITELGRRMLAFPLHPRYSRMLLAAQDYGCVYDACLISALTQGRDILVRNPGKEAIAARENAFGDEASSDFWILMRAWEFASQHEFRLDDLRKPGVHSVTARQVGPLHEQFLRIAKEQGLDIEARELNDAALRKCILIGFSDRVGRRLDESGLRCELVHGRRGNLSRETAVRGNVLFVAAEIQEIGGRKGEVDTSVSLITAIEIDWLRDLFPNDLKSELQVTFDSSTRRVLANDVLKFRDLVLEAKRVEPPPADAAAHLLAEEVVGGRLNLQNWDHGVDQWIQRLNLLAQWCPDLQLPAIETEDRRHIIEQLCLGAASYKEIRNRDVRGTVQSWLSAAQRELIDKYAPERVTLSNGRTPKITYEAAAPFISLRIQELFGVTQIPRIAMGRIPLSIHILAPSMRPVQVTQDLANFWKEHYPRIKSELQRKYPKHEWR